MAGFAAMLDDTGGYALFELVLFPTIVNQY